MVGYDDMIRHSIGWDGRMVYIFDDDMIIMNARVVQKDVTLIRALRGMVFTVSVGTNYITNREQNILQYSHNGDSASLLLPIHLIGSSLCRLKSRGEVGRSAFISQVGKNFRR